MAEKHRWYDVIVAWANGEKIQFNFDNYGWEDFNLSSPGFDNEKTLWRIKPKTKIKKYRMALVSTPIFNPIKKVIAVDITASFLYYHIEEHIMGFIKWIGDVVEVEIEE